MGRPYVRHEGIVEECGGSAYMVRFTTYKSYDGEAVRQWVHQDLITDVLPAKEESESK